MNSKPTVVCFDLVDTFHFLWSVAHARAVEQETKVVWQPYRESSVLNAIYWALSPFDIFGSPGTTEITQNSERIIGQTDKYFDELTDSFLKRAVDGSQPLKLAEWIEAQHKIRNDALESVKVVFSDSAQINQAIIKDTGVGIKRLAGIHFWSTVALTGLSCGVSIGLIGGIKSVQLVVASNTIPAVYGVLGDTIRGWKDNAQANVIAVGCIKEGSKELVEKGKGSNPIAKEAIKQGMEHGLDYMGKKAVQASTGWVLQYLPRIRAANGQIKRYAEEAARKTVGRKQIVATRRLVNAEAKSAAIHASARTAIRVTRVANAASRGIPIVFAAYDVLQAIHDYNEDVEGQE
jgi:hypothetical protein